MLNIRNFSIIAHIDHGKSTLSDRFIQFCGALTNREMKEEQILDSMEIEKERGITIKAQSVRLNYISKNRNNYQINFIDTPGHVDFSYEVSRSLTACEGALLLVDSTQGVEAQTLANCYIAIDQNLEILPVLNKIDLAQSEPDRVAKEIQNIIGLDISNIIKISAKHGTGIQDVLESIIKKFPPPTGDIYAPLQALIIDSWFDIYLGVISLIKIKNGTLKKGDKIQIMSTKHSYTVEKIGVFTPKMIEKNSLFAGEVGFLIANIRNVHGAFVGDTITHIKNKAKFALEGFKRIQPQVYAGMFPVNANEYSTFRDALEKLQLNDIGLFYEPENSKALGMGFRCGFLGLLHMDIIYERLKREYSLQIITSYPTVQYEVLTKKNQILYIDIPAKLPDRFDLKEIREPIASVTILSPKKYIGNIISLCVEKRGVQKDVLYLENQILLEYLIPMSEIVFDFFNKLKSVTKGYASLEYKFKYYTSSDIVCLDILINRNKIDALSILIHRNNVRFRGKLLVEKLKKLIPKHMFNITIQAFSEGSIIARSDISALRKNVTDKCYGGDITRKRKLLEKQKLGKKKMRNIGRIKIPESTFLEVLKF